MIPYRVLLPVVGALATLVTGVALSLLAPVLPAGWAVVVVVVMALLTVLATERLVHVVDVFLDWSMGARSIAFRLIAAAVLADAALAAVLVIAGLDALLSWLLALAALTTVQVLAGALANAYLGRLHPRLLQERQRRSEAAKTAQELALLPHALVRDGTNRQEPDESHDILVMRMALKKIKLGWLVIKKATPLQDADGTYFGIQFEVQITAEAIAAKNKRSLSTESAEPIAVSLSELLNKELETRWVGIQALKRAGGYTITVTTQDVMARIYPYVDVPEWADVREPALLGYGLDAKPVKLLLRKHGQFIGKTRSGKTSVINIILAYLTRCKNAVVWICGTEKLYDTLAGWLEIYLDTGEEMPFDFICVGPKDTAECLAALMRIARYRQSLRLHKRAELPDIICVLGEAMFALRNTTVTVEFDGQELHMSAMAGNIAQGAASAGTFLYYDTQRDTNDQLGPMGGDIQAQVGFTVALNTQDGLGIGRLLGDFRLPPPTHKGEYYIKDDDGEPWPVLTKGTYIQEDDPSKPVLHGGPTLSEISWSRRKFRKHLDVGSQQAAGEFYLNRPRMVTEEFLDYLRKVTVSMGAVDGVSSVSEVKTDDVTAEAAALAAKMGLDFTTLPPPQREAFLIAAKEMHKDVDPITSDDVITPAGPAGVSRADQIVWVLRQWPEPMTSSQIIDALKSFGFEVKSDGAVYNLLGQLVEKNVLVKSDDRLFSLPE